MYRQETADLGWAGSTTTLLEALKDPSITSIVLTSNYTVGSEFDAYLGSPIPITRNVTLTGLPQVETTLDLKFKWAVVELCPSCSFTVQRLAIANERRGNGASVDFFRGRPGSVLALHNTQRVRPACTSASISTELIMTSYARSRRFPNPGMQQRVRSITTTFQGKVFSKQLQLDDFATDLPLAYQEGRGLLGGFTILVHNTTRIFVATVSEDCLKIKSSDACVNSLIDEQMENASHDAAAARQQPTVLVAAVVGAVVGGVLLAAAAAVCIVRRRRHAAQQQQQQLDKSSDGSDGSSSRHAAAGIGPGSSPHGPDIEQGLIKISAAPAAAAAADVKSTNDQPQLLDTRGWQMTTESTAPSLSIARDDHIQWGVMLGAGSFGKVYKGFWGGREVAIKVIEHDSETAAAVENEVTLMLSFNHPNIVRAFHFRTFTQSPDHTDEGSFSSCAAGIAAACAAATAANAAAALRDLADAKAQAQQASTAAACPHAGNHSSSSGAAGSAPAVSSFDRVSGCAEDGRALPCHALAGQGEASASAADEDVLLQRRAAADASTEDPSCNVAEFVSDDSQVSIDISLPARMVAVHDRKHKRKGSLDKQQQQQRSRDSSGQPRHDQQQQQLQQSRLPAALIPLPSGHNTPSSSPAADATAAAAAANIAAAAAAAAAAPWSSAKGGARELTTDEDTPVYRWYPGIINSNDARFSPQVSGSMRELARAKTMLVLEFCDLGTLANLAATKWLPELEGDEQMLRRLLLLRDAARGLQALHAACVVHGDLNARNVLVSSSRCAPYGLVAKLADLGLSRVIKQHSTHRTTNTVGTLSHMPPEMLRFGRMSPAADSYAFGIMLLTLWTGQEAFRKLHYGQYFEAVVLRNERPPIPPHMPEDYSLLMTTCWSVDPADRPTAEHILECLELMIRDRQLAVQKAQQQQAAQFAQQQQQAVQQQLLHRTCSSHAMGLQTPAASAEGLAAWQARGGQAVTLLPAAPCDSGDGWARQQQQQMRLSSDGGLSGACHTGTLSSSSSSGTYASSAALQCQQCPASAPACSADKHGSPGVCTHQRVQIMTAPLVFEQQQQQQLRLLRQQRQQPERSRSSRMQERESHLEPSVFIESL